MSGNVKFRWFLLAPIFLALLVIATFSISWAGQIDDAQQKVNLLPSDPVAHYNLGVALMVGTILD